MAVSANDGELDRQQTFDSTVFLFEAEGGVASEFARPENAAHGAASSVWDVRGMQWPPRSPKSIVEWGHEYVKSPSLVLELLFLGAFVYLSSILPDWLVEAHYRPIPIQNISTGEALIDLTFANDYHDKETIPKSLLTLCTVVLPLGVFIIIGIFFGARDDTHAAICMYLLTMGSKDFIVDCIKNYVGYFRPSFYNMCQFNPETLLCDDETTSARRSFPSGHSASAMASMVLLALYLLGKVRGANRRQCADPHDVWTPSATGKVLALTCTSPVLLGMFIATSRVRDNWHHPADIVGGGVIGAACAVFAHGLWYPPVYSPYGGIPLSTVERIVAERRTKRRGPEMDDIQGERELQMSSIDTGTLT